MFGARAARSISILYGGSMNEENAANLLAQLNIDGGLIRAHRLNPVPLKPLLTRQINRGCRQTRELLPECKSCPEYVGYAAVIRKLL